MEWVEGRKVRGKGRGGWRAMGGDHRQCVEPRKDNNRPPTEPPGCVSKRGSWRERIGSQKSTHCDPKRLRHGEENNNLVPMWHGWNFSLLLGLKYADMQGG